MRVSMQALRERLKKTRERGKKNERIKILMNDHILP